MVSGFSFLLILVHILVDIPAEMGRWVVLDANIHTILDLDVYGNVTLPAK